MTPFVLPLASPDPALSVALATLRASLLEALRSSPGRSLVNFFHSHSPFPLVLSHFTLHPAPIPSIARRGSSSFLKVSQLAYIHFNNQKTVTKSASSRTTVYTFRSPGRMEFAFSEKDEESMVAKYSDLRVRMSE